MYDPRTGKVYMTILEQSHRYAKFGNHDPNNWGCRSAFKLGNDLLVSHPTSYPRIFQYRQHRSEETWFLVNPDNSILTGEVLMSLPEWERFKKLVEAYNEWGKEKIKVP